MTLTLNLDRASGDSLANGVACLAHVIAGVLGIRVQNVKRHETKVVGGLEAMSLRNGATVAVPLDTHCWIVDGSERRLEMGTLALGEIVKVAQRASKLGLLIDGLLVLLPAVTAVALEVLNLLQCTLVLSLVADRLLSCNNITI